MELGYHVTLVRDATAASTHEVMRAAHEVNGPTFAHAIVMMSATFKSVTFNLSAATAVPSSIAL